MSVPDPLPRVPDLLPLASLRMPEWPGLARTWINEGHNSQLLADFAALTAAEGHVLADMMLDVLRSLGVDVGSQVGVSACLFEISGLARRCRRAIGPVAADLERTWKPIPLQVMTACEEPPLFVQVIVGKDLSSASDPMTAQMDDDELLMAAATQVSEAFMEVAGYLWPLCPAHGRRMVVRANRSGSPSQRAAWRCDGLDGHTVGEVGHLQAGDADVQETWWARAEEYGLTDGS